jgi:hypothetical protein
MWPQSVAIETFEARSSVATHHCTVASEMHSNRAIERYHSKLKTRLKGPGHTAWPSLYSRLDERYCAGGNVLNAYHSDCLARSSSIGRCTHLATHPPLGLLPQRHDGTAAHRHHRPRLCEKKHIAMSDQWTRRLDQLLKDTDVQEVAANLEADLPSN